MTEKEFILKMPKESKIDCLEAALAEENFSMFLSLSRILLDAPLDQGGLETEVIEAIYDKHLEKKMRAQGFIPINEFQFGIEKQITKDNMPQEIREQFD